MLYIYYKYYKADYKKTKNEVIFDQTLLNKIKKIMINNDLGISIAEEMIDKLNESHFKNYRASDKVNNVNMENIKRDIMQLLLTKLQKQQELASLNRVGVKTPEVFVLLGNNGVGKTNFAVKLAYYLMEKRPRKILITSLDFFRAGAWQQLKLLVENNPIDGLDYFEPKANNVKGHTYDTYEYGSKHYYDAIILDTSGRIHTNDNLMDEIKSLQEILKSKHANIVNILVLDNNFGTMAINSLEAFNEVANLNGIVITKTDSGFGGGWVFKIISNPSYKIKFFGQVSGEKLNSFSDFNQEIFCKNLINWNRVE